ncbi:MAG: NAD(P)-dependent oxidoreductase [Alphaproteobacteria bacterium]|nr:NAD(P)-dependent oxidoreductase [Alphaproteobacteria bacterium]
MTGAAGRLYFPEKLAGQLQENRCEIILTGGGGWIGQAALEMLEHALGDHFLKRVQVFGASTRDLPLRSGRIIPCQKLETIRAVSAAPKLFFHCAFLTKDRLQDQSVDAFIAGNNAISDAVATAIESSDTRGLFMPSSGAVYRKGTHIIDNDLAANPYGVMKHQDEQRFLKLAQQKKMPVSIPRLFNLSGPFINKVELYALASMIAASMRGETMTIRASHRVIRSYIHVADLVALGFSMLLDPKPTDSAVFDTAGEEALELSDLASAINNALGHDAPIHRPTVVTDKDDRYVGDGAAFKSMLCAHGLTAHSLNAQIQDTAAYLSTIES